MSIGIMEKAGHQVDGGDSCPDDAKTTILGQQIIQMGACGNMMTLQIIMR